MQVLSLIGIYFAAANLIEFALMGIDKARARRGKWRIPESTLFLFTLVGGSIGGLVGMQLFRHKTQKPAFYIGYPVIFIIQVLIVLYLIFLSPFSFTIM